jgi:hypothetical protein
LEDFPNNIRLQKMKIIQHLQPFIWRARRDSNS